MATKGSLGKIIKIVITDLIFLNLQCTKFDFSGGSVPNPVVGFKGATSKEKKKRGMKWEKWSNRAREGGEAERRSPPQLFLA